MNQAVEYMVEVERLDGTMFARRFFKDKQKALEYAKALEKKYTYLIVHMLEV